MPEPGEGAVVPAPRSLPSSASGQLDTTAAADHAHDVHRVWETTDLCTKHGPPGLI